MKICKTKQELQEAIAERKNQNQSVSIGFVPTMGALHEGHLTLMRQAKQENDIVVCSIFVNPIQFNNKEDLAKYPRQIEQDIAQIDTICDICFTPTEQEMYPTAPQESYNFGSLETVMEGAMRPGHFNGVCIVVKRLFDLVQPDKAYFGEKDFQQLAIIRRMVQELNLPISICPVKIVRAEDGLALSSRNKRLSPQARSLAPFIFQTLSQAKEKSTDMAPKQLEMWIARQFETQKAFSLEYAYVVDANTLQCIDKYEDAQSVIICIAVWLDNVRLIDNMFIK